MGFHDRILRCIKDKSPEYLRNFISRPFLAVIVRKKQAPSFHKPATRGHHGHMNHSAAIRFPVAGLARAKSTRERKKARAGERGTRVVAGG